MCTHQRFVTNRYTGSDFLCKCGKCPSCLQEKAYKRSFRIKTEVKPDLIALSVTLTYDRASCPFVFTDDLDKRVDVLNVYREFYTRRVPVHTEHGVRYLDKRYFELTKLNEVLFPDYDSLTFPSVNKSVHSGLATLAYRPKKVGVAYYPDVQNFKKRLRINLKRKYDYDFPYKVYACSEYGESSSRPHFHLLFFIRPDDEALFRSAVAEAWPFADKRRTKKYTEIARDMANYMASYVNCRSFVHGFLSANFKPKHSYSKDFGMSDKLFSLDSVLQKVSKRDLSYLRPVGPKGRETYVNLPLPKYVINRYFPKFKGYFRLNDVEVLDVIQSFIRPNDDGFIKHLNTWSKCLQMDYIKEDFHNIQVRLSNSYARYCELLNLSPSESSAYDYAVHFRDTWKVYTKTLYKLWYEDGESPQYKFDNVQALYGGLIKSPHTLNWILSVDQPLFDDPNDFPFTVSRTNLYEQIYDFRSKERKKNNFVASRVKYYM